MLNVDDNSLDVKNDELKSHLEYYNKLGAPIVEEYSKDLDEKVSAVKNYLQQIREYNLDFDIPSLQKMLIDLSTVLYFTQEKYEKLSLLDDISKIKYKKVYNDAYTSKQGAATVDARKYTADQLRAIADTEALEENLINFIYNHAAATLKSKLDAGQELLKCCSKILSAEIQSMQTFNVSSKYHQ